MTPGVETFNLLTQIRARRRVIGRLESIRERVVGVGGENLTESFFDFVGEPSPGISLPAKEPRRPRNADQEDIDQTGDGASGNRKCYIELGQGAGPVQLLA